MSKILGFDTLLYINMQFSTFADPFYPKIVLNFDQASK